MPERNFKYYTTAELLAAVKELGQAVTSPSGAVTALRSSSTGWLREAAELSPEKLGSRYREARWEIWYRGQGKDALVGATDVARCLALEPTDPLLERVMRVTTIFR